MGFTGAIVADQKDAFVVDNVLEPELGNDLCVDQFRHTIAHDIAADELFGLAFIICAAENDD